MKKPPLASIVVPTYNNEDTIEACLRTLIRQSYPGKEIIVVNDGSTDRTIKVLCAIAKDHPSISVISVEHGGRSKARNIGVEHANGEIIFFGEGDAIYERDYLEKAVALMGANPKMGGVCATGSIWKVRSTFVTECIAVESTIKRNLFKEGKLKPFYAWVYRKEAIEAIGSFDERLSQAEDKDLFLRVKNAGYSIGLITGINWRHRRGQDTWTYLKRCYIGGEARILYILKHQRIMELLKNVGPLWLLVLALLFAIFSPLPFYAILFVASLFMVYKLLSTLKTSWNYVKKKRYLFLLPVFSAMRYTAAAVGYTQGLVSIIFKKLK